MTDIELFAGGGGMAVGLSAAGFQAARMYEQDPYACATLKHNLQTKAPTLSGESIKGNVEDVDWRDNVDDVRLLAAGAPCQPFSLGGRHKAERDSRNLFPEVLRAARQLKPRAIILENVRGLIRPSFRPYFNYILRQLETPSFNIRKGESWLEHDKRLQRKQITKGFSPEYWIQYRFFDAADYGLPQRRCRVFIVATRRDFVPFNFPSPTHSRHALLESKVSGEYWDRHKVPKRLREKLVASSQPILISSQTNPWITVRDALAGLPVASKTENGATMNHWHVQGARSYSGHSGSSLDWPSKTIKAGVHGVPGGENMLIDDRGKFRYYTLREIRHGRRQIKTDLLKIIWRVFHGKKSPVKSPVDCV